MAKKRNGAHSKPEPKRLHELRPEFDIILAAHRGEEHDPAACRTAMLSVNAAILKAAAGILRSRPGLDAASLSDNARYLWWRFMGEDGGFGRYDGVRPFADYAYIVLKRICFGRENLRDQFHRRVTVREPKDDRRNPNAGADRKPQADRRQVPLETDAADWKCNPAKPDPQRNPAEIAQHRELRGIIGLALWKLPKRERQAVVMDYWKATSLAEAAAREGRTPNAMYQRVFHALHRLESLLAGLADYLEE